MKMHIQYGPDDIRELIERDLNARGYAVLPEIRVPEGAIVIVLMDNEAVRASAPPTLQRPAPHPDWPPTPPAAPVVVQRLGADPPEPPKAITPAPQAKSIVSPYSSGNAKGNPLYEVIDIPDLEHERQVKVREIGSRTGLVRRLTGQDDPGDLEDRAARRGETGTASDEEANFLSRYMSQS